MKFSLFISLKKKMKTIVEAIYEPPQEPDPDAAEGFEQLDDQLEEKVDAVANLLGLQKVGWIFGGGPKVTPPPNLEDDKKKKDNGKKK